MDDDVATAAETSTDNVATTIVTKNLKKLSISSDSSGQMISSPPAYDSSSIDDGLGCSDTSLHNIISSKPPLPTAINQRKRSRSIETASAFRSSASSSAVHTPIKPVHRHSIGGRLWSRHFSTSSSVHDYDAEVSSKTKR